MPATAGPMHRRFSFDFHLHHFNFRLNIQLGSFSVSKAPRPCENAAVILLKPRRGRQWGAWILFAGPLK
jgi:hypothetical protein